MAIDMQLARSIFERITAQALLPMITLGVSGAIAATLMEFVQSWRDQHALQPVRTRK